MANTLVSSSILRVFSESPGRPLAKGSRDGRPNNNYWETEGSTNKAAARRYKKDKTSFSPSLSELLLWKHTKDYIHPLKTTTGCRFYTSRHSEPKLLLACVWSRVRCRVGLVPAGPLGLLGPAVACINIVLGAMK